MSTLTPSQAADMAAGVYAVRQLTLEEIRRLGVKLGGEPNFSLASADRFTGLSGAVVKLERGFGYLAEGEGAFRGELACVTRGTEMTSLADWASNANASVQVGPGGKLVHGGFNDVWKSFRPMLDAYLRNRTPTHIHCVGHSLGGALAFLSADYFSTLGVAPVSVYTFGSPRTGTGSFAKALTDKIGADRIFRTSHMADPVTMLPYFPFHHAPNSTREYVLAREAGGGFISFGAHSMDKSYSRGVANKGWGALQRSESEVSDPEIERWLDISKQGGGVLAYSAEALRMIGRLLRWIVRKAALILAGGVSLGYTASVTLLDQMAGLIAVGAKLTKELGVATVSMVRAIFRFMGYVAEASYDITARFLSWLLNLLVGRLIALARRAIALV